MYQAKQYTIQNYTSWNHELHSFIRDFISKFDLTPNIALTNDLTLDRINLVMSTELINEGKTRESKSLETFVCDLGTVDFCLDRKLKEKEVTLVFDDEAEFYPDDGESTSYRPETENKKMVTGDKR